ncbi:hypothetical protein KR215_001615, partial [Drosophila sulfurigaster]
SINESIETDANDSLHTLVDEMGYSKEKARQALSYANNNLELAVQYLLEGDAALVGADGAANVSYATLQRRFKQLRHQLLDNPALNEYKIASLMKETRTAEDLRDMVDNHSVQFLSMLQESSDEEEEQRQKKATT